MLDVYLRHNLNRKYDVLSCLSQSEDLNTGVLLWKQSLLKCVKGRAM